MKYFFISFGDYVFILFSKNHKTFYIASKQKKKHIVELAGIFKISPGSSISYIFFPVLGIGGNK